MENEIIEAEIIQEDTVSNVEERSLTPEQINEEYENYLLNLTEQERIKFNERYSLKDFFQDEFREDLLRSHLTKNILYKHLPKADEFIKELYENKSTDPRVVGVKADFTKFLIDRQIIKNELPKVQEHYSKVERINRTETTINQNPQVRVTKQEMLEAAKIFEETEATLKRNKEEGGI